MKLILYIFLSLAAPQDSLKIMFWNVENFFDFRDSGTSASDAEFSSTGSRHWTKKRFKAKCQAVAKTIFAAADAYGGLPDVVGLAEVENAYVLRRLLDQTVLRKTDYAFLHYDSPDPRGIDVALLWRKSRLKLLDSGPCRLEAFATRDILSACFAGAQGDSIAVFVCHLPSKHGGAASEGKRVLAVERLLQASDSLREAGWCRQAVVGDFNDGPMSETFAPLERKFRNLAKGFKSGTIRFSGVWETIDQALVSRSPEIKAEAFVCDFPFLSTQDKAYGGTKPLRTYSGPAYLGGISDHYPIILMLEL